MSLHSNLLTDASGLQGASGTPPPLLLQPPSPLPLLPVQQPATDLQPSQPPLRLIEVEGRGAREGATGTGAIGTEEAIGIGREAGGAAGMMGKGTGERAVGGEGTMMIGGTRAGGMSRGAAGGVEAGRRDAVDELCVRARSLMDVL
jgi:hypothetical protein